MKYMLFGMLGQHSASVPSEQLAAGFTAKHPTILIKKPKMPLREQSILQSFYRAECCHFPGLIEAFSEMVVRQLTIGGVCLTAKTRRTPPPQHNYRYACNAPSNNLAKPLEIDQSCGFIAPDS